MKDTQACKPLLCEALSQPPPVLHQVLFLGSGFSIPAALPNWADLLKQAASEAQQLLFVGRDVELDDDTRIVSRSVNRDALQLTVVKAGRQKAEVKLPREQLRTMSREVSNLLSDPSGVFSAEVLELAGQLLEDSLGDILKWLLKRMLERGNKVAPPPALAHESPTVSWFVLMLSAEFDSHEPVECDLGVAA